MGVVLPHPDRSSDSKKHTNHLLTTNAKQGAGCSHWHSGSSHFSLLCFACGPVLGLSRIYVVQRAHTGVDGDIMACYC